MKEIKAVCMYVGWGIHTTCWAVPGPQLHVVGQWYKVIQFQLCHPRLVLCLGCLLGCPRDGTAQFNPTLPHQWSNYEHPSRAVHTEIHSRGEERRCLHIIFQIHFGGTTETTQAVSCKVAQDITHSTQNPAHFPTGESQLSST